MSLKEKIKQALLQVPKLSLPEIAHEVGEKEEKVEKALKELLKTREVRKGKGKDKLNWYIR